MDEITWRVEIREDSKVLVLEGVQYIGNERKACTQVCSKHVIEDAVDPVGVLMEMMETVEYYLA